MTGPAGYGSGSVSASPLMNRQKPGGLQPQVLERVFRADGKKLPAIVGLETPMGYSLVRVTKVSEVDKIDDAQREALGGQLRQAVAMEELDATLASLRERVGVSVKKGALDPKEESGAPAQSSAPQQPPKRPKGALQ